MFGGAPQNGFIRLVAALALCLALAAGSSGSVAQPLPPLDEYHVRTFGLAEGLQSAFVHRIERGSDGLLYVSHEEGVFRFDGERFERVPMPGVEGTVGGWVKDARGRLWVSMRKSGRDHRDRGVIEHGRFHRLNDSRLEVQKRGVVGDALWSETSHGLVRIRFEDGRFDEHVVPYPEGWNADRTTVLFGGRGGSTFRARVPVRHVVRAHPLPNDDLRLEPLPTAGCFPGETASAFVDARGVWLAGREGVCYATGSQARPVDPDTLTLDAFALLPKRYFIKRHLAGELWMGTYVEAAIRRTVDRPALLEGRWVSQLLYVPSASGRARQDTYWLVLEAEDDEAGMLVRLRGGEVRPIPLRDVLDFHQIRDVASDEEGNLWVGTDQGIVHLAPRRTLHLPPGPLLDEGFTTALLQTRDEAVWVGTWGGGLHRYAEGRLTHRYTVDDGLPSPMIRALHEAADGTLWIGTDRGVATLTDGRLRRVALPPPATQVRSFTEAPDGTIWIADKSRLYRRTPDGTISREHADLWERQGLWAVHRARDGTVWLGTESGLFRFADGRAEAIVGMDGQMPYVVSIYEAPDGTLWFGTFQRGLYRYRASEGTPPRLVPVTMAEGLHSDGIWQILPDGEGGLWLSSNQGIAYVRHRDLNAVADAVEAGHPADPLQPLVFTEAEGLPSRECNRASPGGWRLADGRLVFNNLRGLVVIEPERALQAAPPPPVTLRTATADGQRVGVASDASLPPGTRHVAIDFSSLAFVASSQIRYRYRLAGYDEEWVDGGQRSNAAYTNLPPGAYTFRVQSASGHSGWGEAAEWSFAIQPFVWQTGWFRLAAALALMAALAFGYRFRVRQLLREERMRLRIASDLHDDVGSSLSSIALLSEMVRARGAAGEASDDQLRRLHETATETADALRDIIWLVDPAQDTAENLMRKMRRVARTQLNGHDLTFDMPTDRAEVTLDVVLIRALFLIYKEALHNVAKHARATRVDVSLRFDEGRVALTVRDDGVGIVPAAAGRGHGLGSMQRRASEVGGTLTVEALPGRGTEVRFEARIA